MLRGEVIKKSVTKPEKTFLGRKKHMRTSEENVRVIPAIVKESAVSVPVAYSLISSAPAYYAINQPLHSPFQLRGVL
jgi:hypothetical protein